MRPTHEDDESVQSPGRHRTVKATSYESTKYTKERAGLSSLVAGLGTGVIVISAW